MRQLIDPLCLVWLAFVFLGQPQTTGGQTKPFLCESFDIKQIKAADVKRIIAHDGELFVFLADKVISMNFPTLDSDEPLLVASNLKLYPKKENKTSDEIMDQVIGYSHVYHVISSDHHLFSDAQSSYELYLDAARQRIQLEKIGTLDFFMEPGRRIMETERNESQVTTNPPKNQTFRDLAEIQDRMPKNYLNFKVNSQSFVQLIITVDFSILVVSQQQDADEKAENYEIAFEICKDPFTALNGEKPLECFERLTVPTGQRKIKFIAAEVVGLKRVDEGPFILRWISLDSDLNFLVECKLFVV